MKVARRSITIRKRADAAGITIRCGDTALGTITGLSGDADSGMTGLFNHAPAYVEHSERFLALARAVNGGPDHAGAAAGLRAENERLGIHVHHEVHDMRIDVPETLAIIAGEVRFRAADAFLMMRTGGLG